MKLFNFTIIALGLMMLFWIAGINITGEGTTSNIIESVYFENITDAQSQVDTPTSAPDLSEGWGAFLMYNWWKLLGVVLLAAIAVIAVGKIEVFGFSANIDSSLVFAVFGGLIYAIFLLDCLGVINFIYMQPGPAWIFWTAAVLMTAFNVMYGFSLIEFIRGTD